MLFLSPLEKFEIFTLLPLYIFFFDFSVTNQVILLILNFIFIFIMFRFVITNNKRIFYIVPYIGTFIINLFVASFSMLFYVFFTKAFCESEDPQNENFNTALYCVLDNLILLWYLLFNFSVMYSFYRSWKNDTDEAQFARFLPLLIFILFVVIFYNEIPSLIGYYIPELPLSTITKGNFQFYVFTVGILFCFTGFTSKLFKEDIITSKEYHSLLFIVFISENLVYLYRESDFYQLAYNTGIIHYADIIYLTVKLLILFYFLVIGLIYLKNKNEGYLVHFINSKIFLYSLIFESILACFLVKGIFPILVENYQEINLLLDICWITLVCVILYTALKTVTVENCFHREKHLKELETEEFSFFSKLLDRYIFSMIPEYILSKLFLSIKDNLTFVLVMLSIIPSTLFFIEPTILISKYRMLVLPVFLILGNLFEIFLSIPTTKKHLYKLGLFCCSDEEPLRELLKRIIRRELFARAIKYADDFVGDSTEKKSDSSKGETPQKDSNNFKQNPNNFNPKPEQSTSSHGTNPGAGGGEAPRVQQYKTSYRHNFNKSRVGYILLGSGFVFVGIFTVYGLSTLYDARSLAFTVAEKGNTHIFIANERVKAVDNNPMLSQAEKDVRKGQIYSQLDEKLAKLGEDADKFRVKANPELKSSADLDVAQKKSDKAEEKVERRISTFKTLWDMFSAAGKRGKD